MRDRRKQKRSSTKDFLKVINLDTGIRLGGLANVSDDGAMIVGEEAVAVGKASRCRIDLDRPILGRSEIQIDVKTRWCRKNLE
ncbi:MAG: PilZ domain-containing protein, partial [candidate division Zixibacteria bacterium]|nr:PilZ domain-containing protein [candidate division Zixibacteria bacterium]